jgi:hypothetical protein
VVDGDRALRAGAFLPLAQAELPRGYGSRHSAAVGLSEVTDALVVAVSEERGEVSIADHGVLTGVADASTLARRLAQLAGPAPAAPTRRRPVLRDALVGAVIFVAVVAAWNAIANVEEAVVERAVAVELHGVPAGAHWDAVPAEVTMRLRGPRRLLVGVRPGDVHAWADGAAAGRSAELPVVGLAPAGIDVAAIDPPHVSLLERRTLPVEAVTSFGARVVRVTPAEVTLVGKVGAFQGVDRVRTQPITTRAPTVQAELAPKEGLHLADDARGTVAVVLDLR